MFRDNWTNEVGLINLVNHAFNEDGEVANFAINDKVVANYFDDKKDI